MIQNQQSIEVTMISQIVRTYNKKLPNHVTHVETKQFRILILNQII